MIPKTGKTYSAPTATLLVQVLKVMGIDEVSETVRLSILLKSKSGLSFGIEQHDIPLKRIQHWVEVEE